ncbi:thermonuclease family protein [Bacillus manliponensis]|uniref:thermonuclease family protein n=1 Tax=Bacillus manliponensis TaxID=574376 RepID=UPI003514BDCB
MQKKLFILLLSIMMCILAACNGVKQEAKATEEVQQEHAIYEATEIKDEQQKQNKNRVVDATVVKNIDGDTIRVELESGKEETVRFLLIDTPETKHPRLGVQPFGLEASDFVKQHARKGKKIQLEFDVSDRDKYGRLLAYIWVDEQMLNRMLVEQGLARVAYVYVPNTKYVDYLRDMQEKAQVAEKGIWSVENYVTDKGFDKVKGHQGETTAETQQFKSCKEAREAGVTNIQKGDPAYSKKLDRDGDGVACDR